MGAVARRARPSRPRSKRGSIRRESVSAVPARGELIRRRVPPWFLRPPLGRIWRPTMPVTGSMTPRAKAVLVRLPIGSGAQSLAVPVVAAQSHLLAQVGQPEAQTIAIVATCLGSREERVHVEPFDHFCCGLVGHAAQRPSCSVAGPCPRSFLESGRMDTLQPAGRTKSEP